MPFCLENVRRFCLVSLIVLAVIFGAMPNASGFANLIIKVGDTTGTSGEQNSVISIFMTNWADSVCGFELWLVLSRPNIIEFQTTYDTTYDTTFWRCLEYSGQDCIDSMDITDSVLLEGTGSYPYDFTVITEWMGWVGTHDVEGTLIENWEWTSSTSLGGVGHDIKVAGYANTIGGGYTPGIPFPQLADTPLVKILADVYEIPEWWEDRTVDIMVQAENLDNFSISEEDGTSIGVITDTIFDSTCFWCEEWTDTTQTECWVYSGVPCDSVGAIIDSVDCCDTILVGHLDTSYVHIFNGTFTVLAGLCGDCNDDGTVNIFDITFLIAFLYLGGPAPANPANCDVNGDSVVNIFDVTYLIAFLYKGGPDLNCI